LEGFFNSSLLISASKKSDILLNQLHIQSKSYDTIINIAKNMDDSLLSAPGIAPVAPNDFKMISSGFGLRIHPITGKLQGHEGVDFAGNIGKPIHCTGNGVVTSVEKNSAGYGNRVIINHGYGFNTLYAHMSKIIVKEGDVVERGQVIGNIGNSGSSTGPHLHYEVIVKGAKKNPINYYINDLSDAEYLEMTKLFTSSN
jgi:murein DD-endopeptidase MepM/ murein hydrolase activator NlpD